MKGMGARAANMVLIDDDPVYLRLIQIVGASHGIRVDGFQSLVDMGSIARMSAYEVAIVDYDLGALDGAEIAAYFPSLLRDMPLILVSSEMRRPTAAKPWPRNVFGFVHKRHGPEAVLQLANAAAYAWRGLHDRGHAREVR